MVIKFKKNRVSLSGFSLLEVGLSIAVGMLAFSGYMRMQDDSLNNIKDKAIADKMTQISQAASKYMQSNVAALSQYVPVGGSTIGIPIAKSTANGTAPSGQYPDLPSLQAGGFLPSSFIDGGINGQYFMLLVQQPTTGNFEAIVTTFGGTGFNDKDLGRIVQYIGGSGGAVMNQTVGGVASGTVQGNGGSWSYQPGTWSTQFAPTAGHVVSNLSFFSNNNLADYLYRHNIGIPEANRMHTAIDFNNNNANNVNTTDTQYIQNSQSNNNGVVQVNSKLKGQYQVNTMSGWFGQLGGNAVGFQYGIYACTEDATNCGVQVSDDGGFYDYNDGWITYNGPGIGLHLQGSNNNLKVDNKIGAAGYRGDETLPNGLAGGISTWDLIAHGGTYVINSASGNVGAYMMSRGIGIKDSTGTNDLVAMTLDSNGKGQVYASGRIGSMGYQPGQGDPSGWGGGLSTWDIVSHGTIANASASGGMNATLGAPSDSISGTVQASQWMQAQVFRPTYTAIAGTSCGTVNPGVIDGNNMPSALPFNIQNGDIAKDNQGNLLSCVNGTWTAPGGGPSQIIYAGSASSASWTNNTSKSAFVEIASSGTWVSQTGLSAIVNGQNVCFQFMRSSDKHVSGSLGVCSFWVLPGQTMNFYPDVDPQVYNYWIYQ